MKIERKSLENFEEIAAQRLFWVVLTKLVNFFQTLHEFWKNFEELKENFVEI